MPHPKNPDAEFKAFAYEQIARVGKALSSPPRLILLNILVNGPHTVEELATCSGQTMANTSRHLQVLKQARLVTSQRRGKHRDYLIASEMVRGFFLQLRDLATGTLAELREALGAIADSPTRERPVEREELLALIECDCVTIVDVRPSSEYARGHLPGAINVPMSALPHRLEEIPRDRDVIVYCRGQLCIMADAAVKMLNQAGFRVRRTDEDVPTWERAGLPIERAGRVNGVQGSPNPVTDGVGTNGQGG